MEGSIECRDHRHPGAENRSGGTDAAHARGVVQRGDLAKGVECSDNLLIAEDRASETVAPVNDTVPHGIEHSKLRVRLQPFNDCPDRLLVITNSCRLLLLSRAHCFKSNR